MSGHIGSGQERSPWIRWGHIGSGEVTLDQARSPWIYLSIYLSIYQLI